MKAIDNDPQTEKCFDAEIFFQNENKQVNARLSNLNAIITKATKHYPKKKKDKECLQKAFAEIQKVNAAKEELIHQRELLLILKELYATSSVLLNDCMDSSFSGYDIIYRFLSKAPNILTVEDAIKKCAIQVDKKQYYLKLINYRDDFKLYFGFGLKYSHRIPWMEWIKSHYHVKENKENTSMNLECSHSSSDQNMYNNDYKNIQLIKETCEDVFKKWNIGAEENASSSEIICGKNNLPKWTLMSLKPPATPCKEIVYAYFKVIEESLNGLVKLANHFWSTEKYFSEKNDFVISIGNKEIIDKLFVVISPNPFGSPHFVLLVMEPKKKVYCLYDPLGLNDNIVRDGVAINQSIEYAKSHAEHIFGNVDKWVNRTVNDYPKTPCINLTGIYIAQFAKQICQDISPIRIQRGTDLMFAELLEGRLLFFPH